ncbi:MAG: class I SAM-dependent methyltransferase [Candidatus Diapherotrites archaeon]
MAECKDYSWKTHKKILEGADFRSAKRVADIGCGRCLFFGELRKINPNAEMAGIEPDKQEAEKARAKGYGVVEPKKINSLGKGFDFIVMTEVIEHLTEGEAEGYFRWAAKALNSGGFFILSTPNIRNLFMLHNFWDAAGHRRPYTAQTVRDLASKFGFEFVKELGVNHYINPLKVAVNIALGMENSCNKIYFLRKR